MLQLWGRDRWNGIRTMTWKGQQRLTSPIMGGRTGRTGNWSGWLQVRAPHAILWSAPWTFRTRAFFFRINRWDFGPWPTFVFSLHQHLQTKCHCARYSSLTVGANELNRFITNTECQQCSNITLPHSWGGRYKIGR